MTDVPFDDVAPTYPPRNDAAAWLAAYRRLHFSSAFPFLVLAIWCTGTWLLMKTTARWTTTVFRQCRRRGRTRSAEPI